MGCETIFCIRWRLTIASGFCGKLLFKHHRRYSLKTGLFLSDKTKSKNWHVLINGLRSRQQKCTIPDRVCSNFWETSFSCSGLYGGCNCTHVIFETLWKMWAGIFTEKFKTWVYVILTDVFCSPCKLQGTIQQRLKQLKSDLTSDLIWHSMMNQRSFKRL